MHLAIESLPDSGAPEQLIVLLHGVGSRGAAMAPLAQALRAEFPQAAVLAPDAPQPWDGGVVASTDQPVEGAADTSPRRQWFSILGIGPDNRAQRVALALPGLHQWLRHTQDRLRVPPLATALGGFSQGAILALETAVAEDGLAGRVLAFSGRFIQPPLVAPRHTTIHLFHGGADAVIPARQSSQALEWLGTLGGDATLDIAEGIGHEIHPALVQRLLFRLRNHIPARTWAAALGAAPAPIAMKSAVPGLPQDTED